MLVTPKIAASSNYVTVSMIGYLVKKGRINKYPIHEASRNYLVDIVEVDRALNWKNNLIDDLSNDLITRKEAADELGIAESAISYYVRCGYITKHYVFGNNYHYLVSRKEIFNIPDEIKKRLTAHSENLRKHLLDNPQPKNKNGRFISRNIAYRSKSI
jgi:predicted site-specific integrase-resolvase